MTAKKKVEEEKPKLRGQDGPTTAESLAITEVIKRVKPGDKLQILLEPKLNFDPIGYEERPVYTAVVEKVIEQEDRPGEPLIVYLDKDGEKPRRLQYKAWPVWKTQDGVDVIEIKIIR